MSRFRIDLSKFLIFKMPEIRRSLNKNLTKIKHIDICVWCKKLRSWDPTEMYCPLSYSNVIVRLLTFVSAWIWSESVQWTFVWWLLYTKFVSSRCVINLFRWNRRSFRPWDFPNSFHSSVHDWAAHQAIKVTGSWEKPRNRWRDERPTVKFYKWRLRARNIPEYNHFSTFTWTSPTVSTSLSLSWDLSESYEEITSVISNGVRATNFVSFWPFLTCFTQSNQMLTLADWSNYSGLKK